MVWAARIPELALQPSQGVGREGYGLAAALAAAVGGRSIGSQQLHQGPCQLLGCPSGRLALVGMPIAITDHQELMQVFGLLQTLLRPAVADFAGFADRIPCPIPCPIHWTTFRWLFHPGPMTPPLRRSQPGRTNRRRRPSVAKGPRVLQTIALLHGLSTARSGSGSGERRRLQHLNIAQRLLDPLPKGLRPQDAASTLFWRILRWGGLGLLVARLLAS